MLRLLFHLRSIIFTLILLLGIFGTLSSGDYSIGTIIETTGMVKDSFSGSWSQIDQNGTDYSGVYTDSHMTNGGDFSLHKQMGFSENDKSGVDLNTEKILQYSSGQSGSHLIADEYVFTSSDRFTNSSSGSLCFSAPYTSTDINTQEQSASFTITNAKQLTLSSRNRYADGAFDYSVQTGRSPDSNATPGSAGTISSRFEGMITTEDRSIQLYDRTLISGLIESFNRMYHGSGTGIELTGKYSGNGSITEKTVLTEQYSSNDTKSGSVFAGTHTYTADLVTNGGEVKETRQITGTEGVVAERAVTYQSAGDRSMQASEQAITTQMQTNEEESGEQTCALSASSVHSDTGDSFLPYKEATAHSQIAAVTSAQLRSSTTMNDASGKENPNLEYRAEINTPIGFNESFVKEMKDTNEDGKFEDLNGNGHLDMHDLVLLFQNFRWIGESNISTRIDFNKNGHADYADIVTVFRAMNQTQIKD